MNGSLSSRTRLIGIGATSIAIVLAALSVVPPAAASAVPTTGSAPGRPASTLLAQGFCVYRIGDYASNDHAIAVRNGLLGRSLDAWIEHHGSLYSGTRTYVVFARGPCR